EEGGPAARPAATRPPHRGALPRARARLAAAGVLLARRTALGVDGARAARDRLGRGDARRRLPRLPARRARPARHASRGVPISRAVGRDRQRQEPAAGSARRARRAGPRLLSTRPPPRLASRRAA